MKMESWVLMSLRRWWWIQYVIVCSCIFFCTWGGIWTNLLAKTCSCASCCVFPYSIFINNVHVNLHRFSGYCKAYDTWRLILDVANARWPLTHFNLPNHSADNCLHTYSMMLLVALTITWWQTFVIYSTSTSLLHLCICNLHPALFYSFQRDS